MEKQDQVNKKTYFLLLYCLSLNLLQQNCLRHIQN